MSLGSVVFLVFSALMVLPTIASISTNDKWWVRIFDFPRIQLLVLLILTFSAGVYLFAFDEWWHFLDAGLLLLCVGYQLTYIFPYTVFAKKEVRTAAQEAHQNTSEFSVLVSNVLTPNRRSDKLIDLVWREQPKLVLTLESDRRWERELAVLEENYPYTVKVPQDNLYGMHLYSKLPLENMEVRFLVQDDIPSIHGDVHLYDDVKIRIHCMHPRPPSPTESDTSTARDAELLLLGRELKDVHAQTLVFGDLNDVAWSRTTKLFHQISGMLDPRIGRGFFNTFHTKYPLLRWPLDHAFHTQDFTLVDIKRLPSIGSDHFPMFVALNHEPVASYEQDEPEAEEEDEEWADEKIEKGKPLESTVMSDNFSA